MFQQKNIIKSLVVLTTIITMVTFSTSFINAEKIITIDSSDVIFAYEYAEFASLFNVYEDENNAIIPISDMPYLAHYENNNKGQFVFQEWLEYEDHASINEFEDFSD